MGRRVEAVAGINQRILQIQSQIARLSPQVAPVRTAAAAPASTLGTTATSPTFEAALAQAMAPATSTTAVGSGRSLLNAQGVPAELVAYGNGKVPSTALATLEGSRHQLWRPAATSFDALRAAAARDGVTIGITDSYRTYASQVDLAERKGLYSQGGLAAAPGTSMHGWGMAVDLGLDGKALAWMRSNAGAYGFVEDTPRESWHWGYHPTS